MLSGAPLMLLSWILLLGAVPVYGLLRGGRSPLLISPLLGIVVVAFVAETFPPEDVVLLDVAGWIVLITLSLVVMAYNIRLLLARRRAVA